MFIFTNVFTFRNITNAMRTFLLSLLIFPRGDMIFFSDIPLSNCSTQFFFYKFIYNCVVFETKFFLYTKGSHYADIFSSLFPIFFRRRNEFSFQTLLCLVLLIAYHSFSTNSFTIASFLKQNSLYIQKVLTTRTFSPLSSQFFSGGEMSFLSRHYFVLFS